MFKRKLFSKCSTAEFLNPANLTLQWRCLIERLPNIYTDLWSALDDPQCQEAFAYNRWDLTEGFKRIKEVYTICYWALGDEIATELFYGGRNPTITGLLNIRDDIEQGGNVLTQDIQTHILLTAVRHIGLSLPGDADFNAVTVLGELSLPKDYQDLLVECFVRVECLKQSHLQDQLTSLFNGNKHFSRN